MREECLDTTLAQSLLLNLEQILQHWVSHVAFLGAERAYFGMRKLWRGAQQRSVSIQEFLYSDNYEALFSAMVREGATAVLILADAEQVSHTDRIARLARLYRLPLISPFRRLTEAGGLMSYGIDWSGVDRSLAVYTARVLGGTKPTSLRTAKPLRTCAQSPDGR